MSLSFLVQQALVIGIALILAYPLGIYLAQVFDGHSVPSDRLFNPLERPLLRLMGGDDEAPGMGWKQYAQAMLWTNLWMLLLIYGVLVLQGRLPWNPLGLSGMEPRQAFNTAISFITNTNWQSYAGEATLSYFSQMASIIFPMFTSAATGFVVAIAFIRAITGRENLGNFYQDLIRFIVRILLPVSIVFGLFFVWQGVPQTLASSARVMGPQGIVQVIPRGPVAALVSIKHFGTNGGGYYSQNSAHPLEDPTPLATAVQIGLMMTLPLALVFAFGRMLGNERQAMVIFTVMGGIFLVFLLLVSWAETAGNPNLIHQGLSPALGNLEGKEFRFGQALSSLFVTATTAFTTGSVNCMHDSLTPLGGLAPLCLMMLNNIFGGKGVGLLNFLLYGIIAVFLTGLMVGRTPELFGKKIEKPEIILASVALLIHPLIILVPSAISLVTHFGLSSLGNLGPHGLSEVVYAFTSAAANNGSAFAGLNANTSWYNVALGIVMLFGRYLSMIALLAIGGSLAAKQRIPEGPGTLRTDSALFGGIWLFVIIIVGALTFFPVLALGPIGEHLAMLAGRLF